MYVSIKSQKHCSTWTLEWSSYDVTIRKCQQVTWMDAWIRNWNSCWFEWKTQTLSLLRHMEVSFAELVVLFHWRFDCIHFPSSVWRRRCMISATVTDLPQIWRIPESCVEMVSSAFQRPSHTMMVWNGLLSILCSTCALLKILQSTKTFQINVTSIYLIHT